MSAVSGQQAGQGGGTGVPGYKGQLPQFLQNPQMGQWMGSVLNTFNSLLANLQRQLGNGNPNPTQGNFMGNPQGILSTLQGLGVQAGQQFGQIFPSLLPRPGMNNQMGPSQINQPSSNQIGTTMNNNQRRPKEQ